MQEQFSSFNYHLCILNYFLNKIHCIFAHQNCETPSTNDVQERERKISNLMSYLMFETAFQSGEDHNFTARLALNCICAAAGRKINTAMWEEPRKLQK